MLNRASGLHYHRFLKRLHENNLFDWYLEVGCRDGASFANVASKTIAVDPFFRADINIIGAKPALHVFQETNSINDTARWLLRCPYVRLWGHDI